MALLELPNRLRTHTNPSKRREWCAVEAIRSGASNRKRPAFRAHTGVDDDRHVKNRPFELRKGRPRDSQIIAACASKAPSPWMVRR